MHVKIKWLRMGRILYKDIKLVYQNNLILVWKRSDF